jgi:hypothetical protein
MSNFFHDWRRQIGVVTLVMACVLMGGWVKSFVSGDRLNYRDGFYNSVCMLTSMDGYFYWDRATSLSGGPAFRYFRSGWVSMAGADKTEYENPFLVCNSHSKVELLGFMFGTGEQGSPPYLLKTSLWRIPYWSIVVPLASLSAYLLLSKPRKASQTPASETPLEKI